MHVHYRKVALAIIQSEQWDDALRHVNGQMTPFRRMIQQMPCKEDSHVERWDGMLL